MGAGMGAGKDEGPLVGGGVNVSHELERMDPLYAHHGMTTSERMMMNPDATGNARRRILFSMSGRRITEQAMPHMRPPRCVRYEMLGSLSAE